MAIVFDAVCPNTSGTGIASLPSTNWTVATGSNTAVFGFIGSGAGAGPSAHSAMRWRGSAGELLTQIGSSVDLNAFCRSSAWRRVAPTAATDTAYGVTAASDDELCIAMVSYSGVDQATPVGTPVTATGALTGATGTATVTVPTTAGDKVLVWCHANPSISATTPVFTAAASADGTPTQRYFNNANMGGWEAMGLYEMTAGDSSTVVNVDISSADNGTSWAIIAFVVNAASAGGGAAASGTVNELSPARNRPGRGPHSLGRYYRPIGDTVVASNVTVAVSGNAATGTVGAVKAAISYGVTGVAGTGAVGTPTSAVNYAATGTAATGAVGTPKAAPSYVVTGTAATGAAGTAVAAISYTLGGNAATGAVGNVSANGAASAALTGVAATGSAGTLTASVSYAATGTAATAAVGTPKAAPSYAATGVLGTGAIGTVTSNISIALAGNAATAAVGSVGASSGNDVSRSLTGVGATAAVGTLKSALTAALSGNAATGAAGTATDAAAATTFTAEGAFRIGPRRGKAGQRIGPERG